MHTCNNCSNCLNEVEKIDATVDSQKVLSCIYRLDQRYGSKTVIDCLKGANNKNVREKNIKAISTYGIMKTNSQNYIRNLIGVLIADGYIRVSGGTYPILRLTEKAKDVLFDKSKVYVNYTIKENANLKEKAPHIVDNKDYDEELFNHLKKVRLDLSKKRNIPPFIIFSDASLKDMASYKPRSEEDFLKIKGVGDKKLMQYGDIFIAEISEFIIDNRKI